MVYPHFEVHPLATSVSEPSASPLQLSNYHETFSHRFFTDKPMDILSDEEFEEYRDNLVLQPSDEEPIIQIDLKFAAAMV